MARLGHREVVTAVLPLDHLLPAPGHGGPAVHWRADVALLHLLAPRDDAATGAAVTAERAFLRGLGGGCSTPVAAYAEIYPQGLHLRGRVAARDGAHFIDVTGYAALEAADELDGRVDPPDGRTRCALRQRPEDVYKRQMHRPASACYMTPTQLPIAWNGPSAGT